MPPRLNTLILLSIAITLYFFFWNNSSSSTSTATSPPRLGQGTHVIDALDRGGAPARVHQLPPQQALPNGEPPVKEGELPAQLGGGGDEGGGLGKNPPPPPPPPPESGVVGQKGGGFEEEYDRLGLEDTTGGIYGNTLNELAGSAVHAGAHAGVVTPTESWTPYSDTPPYTYNPYPDYNKAFWREANEGTYVPCKGPEGEVRDVMVFSGHPRIFEESPIGSYVPLVIDMNVCFERLTRLGPYGFQEEESKPSTEARGVGNVTDWSAVSWGLLQGDCARKNSDRYSQLLGGSSSPISHGTNSSVALNGTEKARRSTTTRTKPRTAVLLQSYSGREFSENDIQVIRALVTELCLRSGGEYQVYLLVEIKDKDIPIETSEAAYVQAIGANVPKEFRDMTVLWNDAIIKETYPKLPSNVNNVYQSQWLPVQKFAQDYPQFDYYWNWDLESRYTGHHYDLLEKLAAFAQSQPRKYLWERNERYYIPSIHGDYNFQFRKYVEEISGSNTIWGPPSATNITAVGPKPPGKDPQKDDDYEWGVGEEADYISLAPIFNPENTTWPGKDDVWGYEGPEKTPRRATIGTQSRCSKKLLDTMHAENLRGNFLHSEMAPQTVALLHGLKAVFAPIPVFFDRQWPGQSLQKWFNPGPKGESGSAKESPFSVNNAGRFEGATWHEKAVPPMRLYNNWMGWEDGGIGGPEWETIHGRMCLPPMLLHPITHVVKPTVWDFSKPEQPS